MKEGSNRHRKVLGKEAEEVAALYLKGKGYTILTTNFRGDGCEIDLIARKDNIIMFAEVKSSASRFPPELQVNERKMQNIARAAESYIRADHLVGLEYRFDLLAMRKKGELWQVKHIKDAFRPEKPPGLP